MQDIAEIKAALAMATESRPARFLWIQEADDGEPLLVVDRKPIKRVEYLRTAKNKAAILWGTVYNAGRELHFVCQAGGGTPARMKKDLKQLAPRIRVPRLTGAVVRMVEESGAPQESEGEEVDALPQALTERVPPEDAAPEGRAEPAPSGRGSPEPRAVRGAVATLLQAIEPTLADAEARMKALEAGARKLDALGRRLLRDQLAGKPRRDEDHAASVRLQARIPAGVAVVEGDLRRITACHERIARVPGWEALVGGGTRDLDHAEATAISEVERRVGRLRELRAEIETALSTSRAALATCSELSAMDRG